MRRTMGGPHNRATGPLPSGRARDCTHDAFKGPSLWVSHNCPSSWPSWGRYRAGTHHRDRLRRGAAGDTVDYAANASDRMKDGSKEQTEQKALPASVKKLRDARRRGMVPHSRDIVAGATLLVTVAYVLMTWQDLRDRILQLIDIVSAS